MTKKEPRAWRSKAITKLKYIPMVCLSILAIISSTSFMASGQNSNVVESLPKPQIEYLGGKNQNCQPAFSTTNSISKFANSKTVIKDAFDAHQSELGKPYITGPNGWIFWGEVIDHYPSQAAGYITLDDLGVSRWIEYLDKIHSIATSYGSEFFFLVTPSTSTIYPEELPKWIRDVRQMTSMDLLLRGPVSKAQIIDLRPTLFSAKKNSLGAHIYSWSNSHWTNYGAYRAWKQIAKCIQTEAPGLGRLFVPNEPTIKTLLNANEWGNYGIKGNGPDWNILNYVPSLKPVLRSDAKGKIQSLSGNTPTDLQDLPAVSNVSKPFNKNSLLFVQDSMGTGLTPFLQQNFSPTWEYPSQWAMPETANGIEALIKLHRPKVVIFELAERHLIKFPQP